MPPADDAPSGVNISIERKISFGFTSAVMVLLAVSASGWWTSTRLNDAFGRVDHTYQVIDLLNRTFSDELTMQASTRGYILTGSEPMLAGYESASARVDDSVQQLRQLLSDNPSQERRLDALGPLVTSVRTIMTERIAARRIRGFNASLDTESFTLGQEAVDGTRTVIEAMESEESRLLSERVARTRTFANANLVTIAVAGVLSAGLVAAASLVLRRDLRVRRGVEEALRSSEERYRALFNSLDEGFCVIEMIFDEAERPVDYRFTEINPSFERQTGLRDAVGKTMRELAPQHEAHWFETYGRIALTGEPARFQNRAEQLHRWYDVYAFRIGDPAQRQVAILFNDISERKRTEAALAERSEQLEAANRELEAFTYSVSHDLRAPLRHIDGFGGMLERHAGGSLDEKGRRYVTTIREAASKMGRLIDDLLAFSRMGRAGLAYADVDLGEMVGSVIRDGRYDAEGRALVWEVSPLPTVRGDASMLRQVWANLIDNAAKYTRDTSPARISVSCRSTGGPNPEHLFCVQDNGAGFDPAYGGKLFGVFQRLHDSTQFEGTGIGLANVRRIVARHGGRTWAEGEVGKGASFFFSLPANPPGP
jgi:PAS domain S-box-containing protein